GRGSCGGPDRSADPSHAVGAAHAAWNLLACELPPHFLFMGTRAPLLACILGARSGPLVDAGYRVGGIGDGDRARRGGTAERAAELWPPLYCGAAMPAYGCCANTLHPLVLGPAPPFARRPPRAQHIRGLAVDAVRGVHAQGTLRHLVHSRRAHPGVELGHGRRHVLPY